MSRQGVVGHRLGTGENVHLAIFNVFFREENNELICQFHRGQEEHLLGHMGMTLLLDLA